MEARPPAIKSAEDGGSTKPTPQPKIITWNVSALLFSAGCKSLLKCIADFLKPRELAILDTVCAVFRRCEVIETTTRSAVAAMGCDPAQWVPVGGEQAPAVQRLVQWASLHPKSGCSPAESLYLLKWWYGQLGEQEPRRAQLQADELRKLSFTHSWESTWTFDDMNLKDNVLRGIYAHGFESPCGIQKRGIVPILDGKHTIAVYGPREGKTTTFAITTLQKIDPETPGCQALVLTASCDQARMFHKTITDLGDYLKVTSHACVSGTESLRILGEG